MFSSMTVSGIGRLIAVTAMASTAVALVPQQAFAFIMGGSGSQNYGAGVQGHVPGYFGSDYGGAGGRSNAGPGGRRVTHEGGVGGRHQPHGGFGGRDGSRGVVRRHEPHGGLAGREPSKGAGIGPRVTQRGVGTRPAAVHGPQTPRVAAFGQPRATPSFKGPGPRGPVRQFGRLGPAAVGGGSGYGQPAGAPEVLAPPPAVYQPPVPAPVAANPAPVYQPPAVQPPVYQPVPPPPAGPVAANPAPAYPTYQPTAPVGAAPAQPAPQAFVAKAPAGAPAAGAPPACSVGSYVTVAFQANVTTEDVKTFLAAYNVAIASGPEADGTYKIQLSACPLTPAEMTQVVDSMRSQTAIIARVGA